MATLSFRNVNKIYDNGVHAVYDFTLEVADKEFIVFVGPSGCGKSTTLRMVAGLEDITTGQLYIDDKIVNDIAPKDRNIAMVFQSYALYPHLTVFDNMAFGLKLRKTPKAEIIQRVNNAAMILGLEPYLDRKPKALSGGQRQRVALGRAIVRDAKVFLMDEPLSNLDAKLRVAMRAELIKLHERLNTTTIYVTHDQIEAMTMATRIVVMKDGYIQQIGSPKDIYDHPVNMFVGGFIGTPAMNFLNGTVKTDGYFYCENLKLKLTEQHFAVLKDNHLVEQPVIFGIRPENIHDDQGFLTANPEAKAEFTVDVSELLGSETNIHINIGQASVIAKVSARSDLRINDSIVLAFDMEKAQFFNPETQLRVK
ncbi:MAG: sn-glycerol-3-phosphate ABC transporter ATP-binding protein UgpC [Candidatus Izemoplasmatales bacterium]|nr:sn-glycerol-3-phosphate ABC transporter ATP-binding protein UgpC [Candidatus Izemoplasmatales bacterium]MDD3865261.1 sn-glycerol-3-phosphate ABC transporter ATP-binding protein UgpC [Candidatus Izemoplasmatales bacterium]